jgi:hypothetical protein
MSKLIVASLNFKKATTNSLLMLYRANVALCSEIYTEYINTLRGQKAEFLVFNLAVYSVTTIT